MNTIAAVIWDLDGTLVDSEPLHDATLAEVVARYGSAIEPREVEAVFGRTLRETHAHLAARRPLMPEFDEFAARYDAVADTILEGVAPFEDSNELVATLREMEIPMAVATSSRRRRLDLTLEACGYTGHFAATAAGDEVSRGKPSPEIYLLTAERLGVEPGSCLALEDSQVGIDAACAAGMRVVAVARDGRPLTGCAVVERLDWAAVRAVL